MNDALFDHMAGAALGHLRAACGDAIDASDETVRSKMRGAIRQGITDAEFILNSRHQKPLAASPRADMPSFEFFRTACTEAGLYACRLLELAGMPVTVVSAMMVIESVPRKPEELMDDGWGHGYCGHALRMAQERCTGNADEAAFRLVEEYFTRYIPTRSLATIDMLGGAFCGVLGGLGDTPFSINAKPEPEPGLLRRWFEKLLW